MITNKVLVIGVGAFQKKGLEYLKSRGFYIVGIDGNANASGKKSCDKFFHCDLNEQVRILEISKREKVDFALGFECDPAVQAINIVNESLGLKALNQQARNASMDKLLVRKIQKKLKLNCPEFHEIYNVNELKKNIFLNKSDWILKPLSSSGSRGVELLNLKSDIDLAFHRSSKFNKSDDPLLLEEFIHGKEIALDGFCVNGQCHALTLSYKDRTPEPYLLDEGLLISSDVNVELALEAKRQLSILFRYLQSDLTSPYHAEFLCNEKGLYLIEFSFRGAGFNVYSKLIPAVTSFNTLEYSVALCESSNCNWSYACSDLKKRVYLGFFGGLDGTLKTITIPESIKNDPLVKEFKIYVEPGDETSFLRSGADRLGHIILQGLDEDSLKEKFYEIKNQVKFIYAN